MNCSIDWLIDWRLSSNNFRSFFRLVPVQDLNRLKNVFRRDAHGDYLSKTTFCHFVLGEAIPQKVSEAIFSAFGGKEKSFTA